MRAPSFRLVPLAWGPRDGEMLIELIGSQGGSDLFDTKLEIYNIEFSDYHYVAFSRNFVFEEEPWLIMISMHAD